MEVLFYFISLMLLFSFLYTQILSRISDSSCQNQHSQQYKIIRSQILEILISAIGICAMYGHFMTIITPPGSVHDFLEYYKKRKL